MATASFVDAWQSLARGWDRLAPTLPVLLMALLALGTYWLARYTPGMPEPRAARAPGADPDYFLKEFSIKTFDAQGRLRSELSGQAGRHFPNVDVIEVDQPRIRAYNLRGEPTVATAKRALSNADGTQVQLIGDAVVVREAIGTGPGTRQRLEIRSEFLHVYTDTERLQTDRPVQIVRGADRFSGERLEFSNLDQQIQLQGRVRGQIAGRRP